jgi:integrase
MKMATRGLSFRDVERLQPRAKAYEVPDPGQAGAIWRVQPSNIKSGIAVYGRGKRVTHELHFPSLTPPAHRAWVRKALSEAMDHGAPLDAKPKGKAGDVKTLEDFLTMRYTEVIEDRKAKDATLAAIRAVFKDLLDKPLAAITSWHMAQFKARRKKAGIAPATINRDLDRIRAALNSAVKLKLLASNPVVGVDRLKVENERVRYLLADEEKRLRKALIERDTERRQQRASGNAWAKVRGYNARHAWTKDEYTDHLAPLVLVAINTGLRRGELFGLTWGRVNLERAQLEVAASTAKTGKVRHVPLNAEALDVLTRWKRQGSGEGLVFPGGEATRLTNINKAWASLVQAAEIEDFHFHDLRHHFASRLMMTGADLYTVSKLLGHSDPNMTQRYAHLSPEHNAAAVAKLMAKR